MTRGKRIIAAGLAVLGLGLGAAACSSDADVASKNLSNAADNFEVPRRIIFINGITDKYLLTIEGYCSLGNADKSGELSVTCKVPGGFKKDFLGLSDNVTYMVEQLDPKSVSSDHYVVNFKPESLVPDIQGR